MACLVFNLWNLDLRPQTPWRLESNSSVQRSEVISQMKKKTHYDGHADSAASENMVNNIAKYSKEGIMFKTWEDKFLKLWREKEITQPQKS